MDVRLLHERVAELEAQNAVLHTKIEQLERDNVDLRKQLEEALRAAARQAAPFRRPDRKKIPHDHKKHRVANLGTRGLTAPFPIMWTSKPRCR